MILRNFLYLNENILNDYLSSLDGHIINEKSQIDKSKFTNDVGGDLKFLKGNMGTNTETTTSSTQSITSAAKLQNLYELMEKNKLIKYIDKMDTNIYDKINRSEILELDVNLKVVEQYKSLNALKGITPLVELMGKMGTINIENESDRMTLNVLSSITNIVSTDNIPIVCSFTNNTCYKIYGTLDNNFIRENINGINGNVTIIGKVQKKLFLDETEELYNPLSNYESIVNLGENKNELSSNEKIQSLVEKIQGPAIKLIPLAIYT